jgi:LacI family transcriptional regulator
MRTARTPGNHITAGDIAARLGLAPTTVHHVLAGRGDRVRIKAETQRRVLDAARELGYRPNASAKAISTGRFGSAALLQATRINALPAGLLGGITKALEANGMHLSVAQLPREAEDDPRFFPKIIRELTADGLLVNQSLGIGPEVVEAVRAQRIPTVWINARRDSDCVHPDDFGAGRMAAEHLLELGHRRIVFVNLRPPAPLVGTEMHYSEADRYGGYAAAMKDAGLTPQPPILLPPVPTNRAEAMEDARADEMERMLRETPAAQRPTALVSYGLNSALPVLIGAARAGLSVPRDLSLIIFHDGIDQLVGVPVTAVQHSTGQMGEEAVKMLLEKIADPETVLPPRALSWMLFPGGTCAPPPPHVSVR